MRRAKQFEVPVKIRDEAGNLVQFQPRFAQRQFLELIRKAREEKTQPRIVVLKARQVGLSAVAGITLARNIAMHDGLQAVVAANRREVAEHLLQRFVVPVLEQFAEKTKKKLKKADPIEYGSSKIWLASGYQGNQAGRSWTAHILHLSEVAHWPKGADGHREEEVLRAMLAGVPDYHICPHGMVIVESTAWGPSGLFYELWQLAQRRAMGWTPFFVPWWRVEKYSLPEHPPLPPREQWPRILAESLGCDLTHAAVAQWLEYVERLPETEMGPWTPDRFWWLVKQGIAKVHGSLAAFKREFPSTPDEAFTATGIGFFGPAALTAAERSVEAAPPPMAGEVLSIDFPPFVRTIPASVAETPLTVWRLPVPGKRYFLGVDCALGAGVHGVNRDVNASVISVWSEDGDQVAEWWSQAARPDLLIRAIIALARYYNNAVVNVERNAVGAWVVNELVESGLVTLFYSPVRDKKGAVVDYAPGSWLTVNTRTETIARFRAALEDGKAKPASRRLLDEMRGVIVRDDRPEGRPDDCVWAAAHAWTVILAAGAVDEEVHGALSDGGGPPSDCFGPEWVKWALAKRLGLRG